MAKLTNKGIRWIISQIGPVGELSIRQIAKRRGITPKRVPVQANIPNWRRTS